MQGLIYSLNGLKRLWTNHLNAENPFKIALINDSGFDFSEGLKQTSQLVGVSEASFTGYSRQNSTYSLLDNFLQTENCAGTSVTFTRTSSVGSSQIIYGYAVLSTIPTTVGTTATGTCTISGGIVTATAITSGGTLYTAPPTIVVSGYVSGAVAVITATLTAGVVTSLAISNAGGVYTNGAQTLTFTPSTDYLMYTQEFTSPVTGDPSPVTLSGAGQSINFIPKMSLFSSPNPVYQPSFSLLGTAALNPLPLSTYPAVPALVSSEFSFFVFFKPAASSPAFSFSSNTDMTPTSTATWGFYYNGIGRTANTITLSDNAAVNAKDSTGTITDINWHIIGVTVESMSTGTGNINFYIDGQLDSTFTMAGSWSTPAAFNFVTNGNFAYPSIWDRVLTYEEAFDLASLLDVLEGKAMDFPLGEGAGTTITDTIGALTGAIAGGDPAWSALVPG